MSVELKQLKEKRQNLYNQQKDLYETAKAESRDLSQEEQTKYDRIDKDFWAADAQIKKLEVLDAENKEVAGKKATQKSSDDESEKRSEAFMDYIRNGASEMSADNRAILREVRAQGTTDTAGGHTIPDEFSGEIEKTMKSFGGMLENCRMLETATGATLDWPTMDDTSNKGRLVSESGSLTSGTTDLTFGNKQLGGYKFSSDLLLVPYELLQDSAFDFASEIMNPALQERIARAVNDYTTTGTGSSQPEGVMTSSAKGADAAASAISRNLILDLIHSVDPSYRTGAKLSFNDQTLKAIKKLAFGSGDDRPLYQISPIVGEADTIEGYQYFINQDIADIGTGNKSMAFGQWNKYIIRSVGGTRVIRLNERFADNDQVGFVVLKRFDGLQVNTGAIKHLLHA